METGNKDIIILIGLPGSGKSTLLKEFEGNPNYEIIDDFFGHMSEPGALNPYDRITQALKQNKKCLISDINFCESDTLEILKTEIRSKCSPFATFEEVGFENSPHHCIANLIKRSLDRGDTYSVFENGSRKFEGIIYEEKPMLELEIENILRLSYRYKQPKTTLQVQCTLI